MNNFSLVSEIALPSGYPEGYCELCMLGITQEELHKTERMQLKRLNVEDKLLIILRKDYFELLDELIFSGEIELGEDVTAFYEKFKYDNLFNENKTTQRLEILILNHDLQEMLEDKPQGKTIKI
jgi:late competence protein required for DNA uptake (superfamily II DNA/RNA helicase)